MKVLSQIDADQQHSCRGTNGGIFCPLFSYVAQTGECRHEWTDSERFTGLIISSAPALCIAHYLLEVSNILQCGPILNPSLAVLKTNREILMHVACHKAIRICAGDVYDLKCSAMQCKPGVAMNHRYLNRGRRAKARTQERCANHVPPARRRQRRFHQSCRTASSETQLASTRYHSEVARLRATAMTTPEKEITSLQG